MPSSVMNYQCPSCGGPLHFDPSLAKMKCDYCGSEFSIEEIEKQNKSEQEAAESVFNTESEWDMSALKEAWGADEEHMRVYSCPACGAALITDDTTAASSCPYCGNSAIIPGQFSGLLKPDYVIPFAKSRNDAIASLKAFYHHKFLLPKAFIEENHIEEIKGIYVPFWLYDAQAHMDCLYEATRVISQREGNEQVTRTMHFKVRRGGSVNFKGVPVDASRKMPDAFMDSIEPFDYREARPFTPAVLPGYVADRYDETAEDCAERADQRCENSAIMAVRATAIGYNTLFPLWEHVHLDRGKVSYALLPVWMLRTKWRGKTYTFAMNGQSGKVSGDLPVSPQKFILTAIAVYVIALVVMVIIMKGLL